MVEAIAISLALDGAKVITMFVAARVLGEVTAVFGFQDQLSKLQSKFLEVQAFLEDLGKAKYVEKSKFVNLWLMKLTVVAYSADKLMDDYAYEMLRRKIELKNNHPSFNKKCTNFFSTATNPAIFRIRMSHRVHKILSRFDKLYKEAKNIGLQPGQLAKEAVGSKTSTCVGDDDDDDNKALHQNRKHAMARDSEFVGRKTDEEKLLQKILNPIAKKFELYTIAIVGIGGLGKTTIARRLYENKQVNGHFKKKIWICVSDDFKVDRLLKEMVQRLTSKNCELTNTDAIANKLQKELNGKKFFLVLDDVWEDNQGLWDNFKNALLSVGVLRKCVMLITTRSIDVANKANALYQHKLSGLSEEEGWYLLQKRVFTETFPYNSCFEDVGRRIVKKCKGVPLAIKAIAGILQSKELPHWESIENSEVWNPQEEGAIHILPSLLLSYNHLDDMYVKQCFAYCAIFPKDFEMDKHQLITLWLAQGFLRDEFTTSSSTSTSELVVGEKYFNTLLNHSFLEEKIDYLDRKWYKMQDLVHDLAAYILEKELLVWKDGKNLPDDNVPYVRHLVFDSSKNEDLTRRLKMRKLRTISFRADVGINYTTTLGSVQYMRTLIMARIGLKEVPSIIGQLVHLRYLDLSYNDEIVVLPDSICKLYQLQTLRIISCPLLKRLPRKFYRLKNLRHIEGNHSLLWASGMLRQLINLQTLPSLELRDGEGWTIDELGPLDQLKGNVFIKGLEHVKNTEAIRQSSLRMKKNIVTLCLDWGLDRKAAYNNDKVCLERGTERETTSLLSAATYAVSPVVNNDEDVLDCLEPHPYLQSLFINGFMGESFPRWIMTMAVENLTKPLENLTKVDIIYCRRCQQLPALGQLPNLQSLRLKQLDQLIWIGDEFYQTSISVNCNAFFPSLKKLDIVDCKRLANWYPPSSKQGPILFRNLESLSITNCRQLKEVPCLELRFLKYLHLEHAGRIQPLDIIKYSHALTQLDLRKMNCTNLETLEITNCVNIKSIPSGLISSLKRLHIKGCSSLVCIPDGLRSLHGLIVEDCKGLEKMPKSLEESTSLEELVIINCPSIKGPIPDLGRLHGLKQLKLENSGELKTQALSSLEICNKDDGPEF